MDCRLTVKTFSQCFIVTLLAISLTGCFFFHPKPISKKDQLSMVEKNLKHYLSGQLIVNKSLTLPEAIARSLKYNLDNRLRETQIALANGALTMAKLDMLPSIDAEWNYKARNNQLVTLDQDFQDSGTTVNPKQTRDEKIQFSWDLLNFGLAYIRAKQAADRVMIAHEQRRKVEQQLVTQVIVAYWKAYSSQVMLRDVEYYRKVVKLALAHSKKAIKSRAASVIVQLDYQQLLIRSLRALIKLQLQLNNSRIELAKLISAQPGTHFRLVKPPESFRTLPEIHIPMKKLDTVAMVYRPELRESSYRIKIASKGVIGAIFDMFPSLSFKYGYNHTDNAYVLHPNWLDTNVIAAWNIMKVLSGPYAIAEARTKKSFEKLSQAALTMTILTQVRLAYTEYLIWQKDYYYSRKEAQNAGQLYKQVVLLEKAHMASQQSVISRGIRQLQIRLDRDLALAKAYEALGKLRLAIGMDYLPQTIIHNSSIFQLTHYVSTALYHEQGTGFQREVDATYRMLMAIRNEKKSGPIKLTHYHLTKTSKATLIVKKTKKLSPIVNMPPYINSAHYSNKTLKLQYYKTTSQHL